LEVDQLQKINEVLRTYVEPHNSHSRSPQRAYGKSIASKYSTNLENTKTTAVHNEEESKIIPS